MVMTRPRVRGHRTQSVSFVTDMQIFNEESKEWHAGFVFCDLTRITFCSR